MEMPLVSIIMPAYNADAFINETIHSVINQTYTNWELLITEDCSTDNTKTILQHDFINDTRIHVFYNHTNLGAAISRNNSLYHAKGEYIAFLDADDLWDTNKLEEQIKFMKSNNIVMCYTSYKTIKENGEHWNTVHVPQQIDYIGFLKRPLTCSHTIVFCMNKIDKNLLIMPNVKRGQDAATWCQVLKTGVIAYGLDKPLAKYRKHANSLSSNKIIAIKRAWFFLRKIERLNIIKAAYCFVFYAFNAVKKRKKE